MKKNIEALKKELEVAIYEGNRITAPFDELSLKEKQENLKKQQDLTDLINEEGKLSFEEFNKEVNPDPLTNDMIDEMYILYAEYLKGATLNEILDSIVEGTVFEKYFR